MQHEELLLLLVVLLYPALGFLSINLEDRLDRLEREIRELKKGQTDGE